MLTNTMGNTTTARTTHGLLDLEAEISTEDPTVVLLTSNDGEQIRFFRATWDGESITDPDLRIPEREESHWEQAFERLSEQLRTIEAAASERVAELVAEAGR